jgi:hypothetical protein
MTVVTLNISKKITVVTSNFVYQTNLKNVIIEANKYDVINLNGITKTEKLNKYLKAMIANKYTVITENWNRINTIADGVSDFSITLIKNHH